LKRRMRGDGVGAPFEPFRRVTIAVADPGLSEWGAAARGASDRYTPDRDTPDRNGDELIRYARMLAAIAPADVSFRFVHVMGRLMSTTHRAALEALTRAAARHLGSEVAWECHVRRGDRIDQVLHDVAEWGSDLLVIGHRKRARGRRSMARRLAMKAPCSLWLVPEGTARPVRRLMVAVDFSEPSAHAAAVAAALARRGRVGHCLVLHVRTTPSAAGGAGDAAAGAASAIAQASDEQAFRRFLTPLESELHGVTVSSRTIESASITGAIGRAATGDGADVVVVATRGQTRSGTLLLGGEAEQLLAESASPILVTRPRGDRPGLLEALLDRAFRPLTDPGRRAG
jgi:sulfate permease, SulP family